MIRHPLGRHPVLVRRLWAWCPWFALAVIWGATSVVLHHVTDGRTISHDQMLLSVTVLPLLTGVALLAVRQELTLFVRMRHFDAGSRPTAVVVAADDSVDDAGDLTRVVVPESADDGGPVRDKVWTFETHVIGAPIYVRESPPTILALRGRRGHLLPILSSGYPFATPAEELRRLGHGPSRHADSEETDDRAGGWRPELPVEFRVSPKMRELHRTFGTLIGLAVLAFTGGGIRYVADSPGYGACYFVMAAILGGGFIVWSRTEGRAVGPLRIDARSVEIASILGRVRVPWSRVSRVSVHGWNEQLKRRRQQVAVVTGLAQLGAMAAGLPPVVPRMRASGERRRSRRALQTAEPVDRALLLAGAREDGIVPDVALYDDAGTCLLRLRGTHSWKAAHALLVEAWARGAHLD